MSETVDGLKQRLIGAFVILSLAVIFLPMLFDKPYRDRSEAVEKVPAQPARETVVISKPQPLNLSPEDMQPESETGKLPERAAVAVSKPVVEESESQPGKGDAQQSQEGQAATNSEKVSETASAKQGAAEQTSATNAKALESASTTERTPKVYSNVWMVQLGTFSNTKNAYALRDRLRALGIDGHTKPIKSGTATRVFAGPFVTKKEALRIKRKLDVEFKVKSLVVFFEP